MQTSIMGLWRQCWLRRGLRSARHRCEYWGLIWLVRGIPMLSRTWVLRLASVVGRVAYWVDGSGRRLAYENLSLAVEHGGLDLAGRTPRDVICASYANFARNFLDLFWFAGLTAEQVWKWVEVEGSETLQQRARGSRGAIHVTAHFGMFELSSLIVGFLGLPLHIVARDFRNVQLTEVFSRARESSGHRVHHRNGVMLKLLRLLRNGGHVAMLPDLSVPPQGAATIIHLFGIPASVTALHVELSKRCAVPIIAAVCEPIEDGKTKLRILDVFDPPADGSRRGSRVKRREMTQRIWDRFETAIHRRPELWLWMYRHWKFRPLDATPESDTKSSEVPAETVHYPSYAVPNAEFGRRCESPG